MAATQADVRRALLDAHPYNLEDLDHAAEIAMTVAEGSIATAGKMLKDAAKGNGVGHFGIKERAERIIARIGAAPEEPEPPAEPIPPTESEQDEDPGPDDEDAEALTRSLTTSPSWPRTSRKRSSRRWTRTGSS